jgi:hypothetical protein
MTSRLLVDQSLPIDPIGWVTEAFWVEPGSSKNANSGEQERADPIAPVAVLVLPSLEQREFLQDRLGAPMVAERAVVIQAYAWCRHLVTDWGRGGGSLVVVVPIATYPKSVIRGMECLARHTADEYRRRNLAINLAHVECVDIGPHRMTEIGELAELYWRFGISGTSVKVGARA